MVRPKTRGKAVARRSGIDPVSGIPTILASKGAGEPVRSVPLPREPPTLHNVVAASGSLLNERSSRFDWKIDMLDIGSFDTFHSAPFDMPLADGSLAKWSLIFTPSMEEDSEMSKLSLQLHHDSCIKKLTVSCEFRIVGGVVKESVEDVDEEFSHRKESVMRVLCGDSYDLNFIAAKAKDNGASDAISMEDETEMDETGAKSAWGVLWMAEDSLASKDGTITIAVVICPKSNLHIQDQAYHFLPEIAGLFNDPTYSDLTLTAGSQSFAVHKAILAARSAKFAELVGAQQQQNDVKSLKIELLPEVAEKLLTFIYSSSAPQLSETQLAAQLHRAAIDYGLAGLAKECGDYMSQSQTGSKRKRQEPAKEEESV